MLYFSFFLPMSMIHLLLLLFLQKSVPLYYPVSKVKNYSKQPIMIELQMTSNTSTFLTTLSKLFRLSWINCGIHAVPLTALLIVFIPKIVTNRMINHNKVLFPSVAIDNIVLIGLLFLVQVHFLIIKILSSVKLSMLSKLTHIRPILLIVYVAKLWTWNLKIVIILSITTIFFE